MQTLLAFAAAFIITFYLLKSVPTVTQWFPLALIIIMLDWVYHVFYLTPKAIAEEENSREEAKTGPQPVILHEKALTAEWKGNNIILSGNSIITARLNRDRHGNITGASYGTAEGRIKSRLITGGRHYYSYIIYEKNLITGGSITWMRDNGSIYAHLSVEHGAFLTGPFEMYYPDGPVKKSGCLLNGRPDGRMKTYHYDGRLKRLLNYKNGVREGTYEICAANGEVIETGAYEQGRLCGYVLKYYEQGGLKEEIYYRRGIPLMRTTYKPGGIIEMDRVSGAMLLIGAKNAELKSLRRLARAREKLGKYGLEIVDRQSPVFPRERGIRKVGSEYNLREFSCEEELIKAVLNREKFAEILERLEDSRSGRFVVRHYNEKGKLVIER